ncbi:MAG: GGDEF domain-containing protein [Novosphingobium sp.]
MSDETCLELVRSLFVNVTATTLMSLLFIVVATVATSRTPDVLLPALGTAGSVLAIARVGVLLFWAGTVAGPTLDVSTARRAERQFGIVYLAFALILGLFAGRVFEVATTDVQVFVGPLIVGYAAGVAAGMSLRPWICVPAVMLAVVPAVAASLLRGGATHVILAVVLTALLAGGVQSMLNRYRSETEKIGLRQFFASLARQDHMTGLANRLALSEAFGREVAANGADTLAVHCLDIDRFKQVNDQYGHPTGDLLLKQVAERLRAITRSRDLAARLGGDEFIVMQTGTASAKDAEFLARRIVRSLSEPYLIDGKRLSVGASVGYALASECGDDFAHLLECADRALYQIKRNGGGGAADFKAEDASNVVRLAG